jgi:hypothetical protein
MLTIPKLNGVHRICWSRDPALNVPGVPEQPTGDDEADKLHAAEWKEWRRLVAQARETGAWGALIREGQSPTWFLVEPMRVEAYDKLLHLTFSGSAGPFEAWRTAFRACVRGVENLGDYKVSTVKDATFGPLCSADLPQMLHQIDPDIVRELGQFLMERAGAPSPKS